MTTMQSSKEFADEYFTGLGTPMVKINDADCQCVREGDHVIAYEADGTRWRITGQWGHWNSFAVQMHQEEAA